MGWDISVNERIYHNLANALFFKIMDGVIPMGSRFPPISALMQEANTSQETMRKALRILVEQKVIAKTYRGYFVTDDKQTIHAVRQQYIEHETRRYQAALSKAACTAEIRLIALGV